MNWHVTCSSAQKADLLIGGSLRGVFTRQRIDRGIADTKRFLDSAIQHPNPEDKPILEIRHMKPTASGLPKTKVYYTNITLSDCNPTTSQWESYWFPRKMVAFPLTKEGREGYGPKNTLTESPAWWPLFQERHKTQPDWWVRGHLLNDNIHGPGGKENLVPISKPLNTNMLNAVEVYVKSQVTSGKILRYTVEAHWEACTLQQYNNFIQEVNQQYQQYLQEEQAKAQGQIIHPSSKPALSQYVSQDNATKQFQEAEKPNVENYLKAKHIRQKQGKVEWPPVSWNREMLHPWAMRNMSTNLLWGEQFAPSRLSWLVEECTFFDADPNKCIFKSLGSSLRDNQWYNNFP